MSFIFRTCYLFLVKLSPAFTSQRNALYVEFANKNVGNLNHKSISLLDVGGSDGYIEQLLSQCFVAANYFVHATVVDISKDLLLLGQKKHNTVNFVCGDVTHLPFKQGAFDTVSSFSVFEHLNYPKDAVKEMTYVSKGSCIVQIPNMHYFIELHTKVPMLFLFPKVVREKIIKNATPYYLNFNVGPKNLLEWFRQEDYGLTDFIEIYHAKWTRMFRTPHGYLYAFTL